MTFAGAVSKEVASKNNSLNIVGMVQSDYFLLALYIIILWCKMFSFFVLNLNYFLPSDDIQQKFNKRK